MQDSQRLSKVLIAIDGLDVHIYDNVAELLGDIEQHFILNGDYTLYTSAGEPILPKLSSDSELILETIPADSLSVQSLSRLLEKFLRHYGLMVSESKSSLEDLVSAVVDFLRRS
jgi:hypothetical protein